MAPVYLVDFSVYNPSDEQRVQWEYHRKHSISLWEVGGADRDAGAERLFLPVAEACALEGFQGLKRGVYGSERPC